MLEMRTTITLDADVEALVKRAIEQRGMSFKATVNDAIRRALGEPAASRPYRMTTRHMGPPRVPLEKALALAAALEDEEITREMQLRK